MDLKLHLTPPALAALAGLSQFGLCLPLAAPATVKAFLCGLGVDPDYCDQRLQTVFVNNHPVDDLATATLRSGDTLALSAAMPGLAGSILRRGGFFHTLRHDISHKAGAEAETTTDDAMGAVTVKCFNDVARELGPLLLRTGCRVSLEDLAYVVSLQPDATLAGCRAEVEGREQPLRDLGRMTVPDDIGLRAVLLSDQKG